MSEYNLLRDFIERDQEKSQLLKSLKKPILRKANGSLISNTTFASKKRKEYLNQPISTMRDKDLVRQKEMDMLMNACKEQSRMEYDACEEQQLMDYDACDVDEICAPKMELQAEKFCPKCGRTFQEDENFCPDCLVILKNITDEIDIKSIDIDPNLDYVKDNTTDDILTEDSLALINNFDFSMADFNRITFSIKSQAFRNLDGMIRANDIDLDELEVLDKVILFTKSFVHVEYKSYGGQLGYFEFDKIYVDDRQRNSLQITTLVHELTHFLVKEILTRTVCEILDCTKTSQVESVVTYILSSSVFNNLIDEYAAHSVEGRFTIFGYQDYSSFLALQDSLDPEHVDIAKTIGNTFSIYIKELLEGFLDWDVRKEIKDQFLEDTIERPNYSQLQFESCNKLTDDGFLKAIWLILSEGFADVDEEAVKRYMKEF